MFLLTVLLQAQSTDQNSSAIISLMNSIDANPNSISFQNKLDINYSGGHLQGIQLIKYNDIDFYFLSGSSDSFAYYAVVKMGEENAVISVNKILDKPFKHAGGFQINNNLMAIGVEDNTKKDRSKVFIYNIDDPENLSQKPSKIIERSGAYKRATAGCVAVIEKDNIILVVVGDWDTKHLDFYKIKKEKLFKDPSLFKLNYTIDTEKMDRTTWIDTSWLSYQNINLLKDSLGNLYLVGMTTNNKGENILDTYKVETEDYTIFKLNKVFTRKFNKNKETSFRWAAGVYLSEDNKLKIFSSGAHIKDKSQFNIYQ